MSMSAELSSISNLQLVSQELQRRQARARALRREGLADLPVQDAIVPYVPPAVEQMIVRNPLLGNVLEELVMAPTDGTMVQAYGEMMKDRKFARMINAVGPMLAREMQAAGMATAEMLAITMMLVVFILITILEGVRKAVGLRGGSSTPMDALLHGGAAEQVRNFLLQN